MAKINSIDSKNSLTRFAWLLAAGLVAGAPLLSAAPKDAQRTFATPQEAVQATIDAAEHNDTAALLQLFGPEGKDIVESGDAAKTRTLAPNLRARLTKSSRSREDRLTPDRVTFTVGEQEWPFPVPVIRRGRKMATGFGHRAGRSSRPQSWPERVDDAMEVCRGYAEAQLEYGRGGARRRIVSELCPEDRRQHRGHSRMGCMRKAFPIRWFAGVSPRPAAVNPAGDKKPETLPTDTISECWNRRGRTLPVALSTMCERQDDWRLRPDRLARGSMACPESGPFSSITREWSTKRTWGPPPPVAARQMARFNPDKSWRPVVLE